MWNLERKAFWWLEGASHINFQAQTLSHTHTHTHTHSHHRVVEGGKKHTVRFGPFWPQSGLMGILWLSAPHSTQSQDVWPPSESIPAGKMNYAEKEKKKKKKKIVGPYYGGMKGWGGGGGKETKGLVIKRLQCVSFLFMRSYFPFCSHFFVFRYSVVE